MESSGPITHRHVWRFGEEGTYEEQIPMLLEEPLSLEINGSQVAVLMRLPGQEKELAAGFCLSEGLVSRFEDILMIHHCGQGLPAPGEAQDDALTSRNRIQMRVRPEALNPEARLEVVRLIRAGCGAVDVDRSTLPLPRVSSKLRADGRTMLGLERTMREAQVLHREVGGVHAVALFDVTGTLITLCEDVGRHNAVDKAVGHCLLRGIPLEDKILLCSGRLSYEMVTKVIRVGIPILCSVSTPTALAVQIADEFNLTLVGYLRGRKMTVYAHPERIKMLPA
ncbi:MAG: formate dehydrogenase accessory sulfurtransferase FdhD [Chloroflexi bacterium]|nr:formate dehydrogenase accessory sulfurtransferase FdhD [Chloroflexota bacterium]